MSKIRLRKAIFYLGNTTTDNFFIHIQPSIWLVWVFNVLQMLDNLIATFWAAIIFIRHIFEVPSHLCITGVHYCFKI